MDMGVDIFATLPTGQLALKKLGVVPSNFRLFRFAWLGDDPSDFSVMRVDGGEFRSAKTGTNAGKLSILVKGSQRTVHLTRDEINTAVKSAKRKKKSTASEPVQPCEAVCV